MRRRIATGLLSIALMCLTLTPGYASLKEIHGTTDVQYSPGFSGPAGSEVGQTITGVRINGAPVFRTPSGATFVSTSGAAGTFFGAPSGEGTPASSSEALTGLAFTKGRTNVATSNYSFDGLINDDSTRIFIGEISLSSGQDGDAVRVVPLSGGTPISTWSLTINPTDWGEQSDAWDPTNLSSIAGRLVSFQLSDFSGGAGTLAGVDGIRLIDDIGGVGFDPNVVGTVEAGLLNATPAAEAAYSLRLLDDTYTGSAIEVRRASGGSPQDIGFTFDGLLDVAVLESFAAGEDVFVTTWYDQSGGANHLTQANASDQPLIYSNGAVVKDPNGNIAIEFDGSDAIFGDFSPWSAETSVFTVGSFSTTVPTGEVSGAERLWNMSNGDSTRMSLGAALNGGTTDPALLSVMSNGGTFEKKSPRMIAENEVFQTSLLLSDTAGTDTIELLANRANVLALNTTFSNTENRFTAGAQTNTGLRGLDGWLNEIVIYNTALSDAQVNSISLNQMGAFGIVPEPSTGLGLVLVFGWAGLWRRRRSKLG